jgi:hypothetical protein
MGLLIPWKPKKLLQLREIVVRSGKLHEGLRGLMRAQGRKRLKWPKKLCYIGVPAF